MDKSKRCILAILATSRALTFPEQEMTWIDGTIRESAYNNMALFCCSILIFLGLD